MRKVIIMVLPTGVDIIAEFVKENDTTIFVKPPKILNYDANKKGYTYADFCIHRNVEKELEVPVNKSVLLTWYEPRIVLANEFIEQERLRNLSSMGIVVPQSAVSPKITF